MERSTPGRRNSMYKAPWWERVWPWGTEGRLVLPGQQRRGNEAQEKLEGKQADQAELRRHERVPESREELLMGFKEGAQRTHNTFTFQKGDSGVLVGSRGRGLAGRPPS